MKNLMNSIEKKSNSGKRLFFLDNLRTFIVFLVIVLHASGPYLAGDTWASFWIVEDPANNDISGIIFLILDIFLMATLFFISGYLAPRSLENRSSKEFIFSKFKRLVIPWFIAVMTLIPLYRVIFLYSHGLPQEPWFRYLYFNTPNSQNWLWFLPVLFYFNIIYALLKKANIRLPNINLGTALVITFIIGSTYILAIDLLRLRDWTLTPLLDFQNERILIYFLYFLLGALCYNRNVFDDKSRGKKLYIIVNATSWIPTCAYFFFILFPVVFSPGNFLISHIVDRTIVSLTFHLSLISLMYTTVETFRYYFDKTGWLWKKLNPNSYNVYIIHVIVMGLITLLLRSTSIPSGWKHVILTVTTYIICILLAGLIRSVFQALKSQKES